MDPSLQEFYSMSRSTSQQSPLTQIISSDRDFDPSSPSGQHPTRERPQSAMAWSQHQYPMSVPSIAQIWIQPNLQQQQHLHPNPVQDGYQQDAYRRRRHHTAGSSDFVGSAPARTGADSSTAEERCSSAAVNDSDSIPYDPFAPTSHPSSTPVSSLHPPPSHDPSIYSRDDARSRRHDYDHPHQEEHLEQLDDYDTYADGDRGGRRSFHHGSGYGDGNGGGRGVEGDQEDISSIHSRQKITPTPLPKIPLFVLSVVIFSEPLTSTILFPFVYFMVTLSVFVFAHHLDSKWIQPHTCPVLSPVFCLLAVVTPWCG